MVLLSQTVFLLLDKAEGNMLATSPDTIQVIWKYATYSIALSPLLSLRLKTYRQKGVD